MTNAFIGLGSNIPPAVEHIEQAIALWQEQPDCERVQSSSFYRTSPVGPVAQASFINAVIEIKTTLPPHALLACCLRIEKQMGRIREERWGPRIIDCDLLSMANITLNEPILTLPHPEMHQRLFVLIPLAEIAPQYQLVGGIEIHQQIQRLQQANVQETVERLSADS